MNSSLIRPLTGTKIVLGVCGGIAAYKSAYLLRALSALGAIVRVVMTKSAAAFIQPMTFQALSHEDVRCELFDSDAENAMSHIELARWADYVVIAPASADFIAKMAHGLADDLLSTLYLATAAPVVVCPAMNRQMWTHAATRANCTLLQARDVMMIGPEEGAQACGDQGLGRMADPETIVAMLQLHPVRQLLQGRDVLITAGPTQEAIDPVRYLGNRSSGKMGYALAQAAQVAGAQVTLISGPCALSAPLGVVRIMVQTAQEMLTAVTAHSTADMLFIGAAAVADYCVARPKTQKLKRQDQTTLTLTLERNPDILASVISSRQAMMVIGFAAETHDVLAHAEEKLRSKQLDMVIANQVGEGLGFDNDENQVILITTEERTVLDLAPKWVLAGQIITVIAKLLQNKPLRIVNEPSYSN
ncbi:MAG: bifunctional phosphopantothenoylcysteine decarboxylase/phosphopantothenate--cysteine ligase CoaBC [Gammaproteobacteria bacterium]|nr:bifunctional phosphopantothenoylcysteine decarboxylase/phosphopantothenate--cysteine ligase CoaBC [Gammaproteobacteria bacterium]